MLGNAYSPYFSSSSNLALLHANYLRFYDIPSRPIHPTSDAAKLHHTGHLVQMLRSQRTRLLDLTKKSQRHAFLDFHEIPFRKSEKKNTSIVRAN